MLDEYRCGDGACILKEYVCDNRPDCIDMSDEISCGELLQCGPITIRYSMKHSFSNGCNFAVFNQRFVLGEIPLPPVFTTPPTTTTTIATKKPPRPPSVPGPCKADQATCQSGECIPRDYVCDGERDCSDGSDEFRCGKYHFFMSVSPR